MAKKLIWKHKLFISTMIGLILIYSFLITFYMLIVENLTNNALANNWSMFGFWAGIEAAVLVISIIVYFVNAIILKKLKWILIQDLRSELSNKLINVNYHAYKENNYFKNGYLYDSINLINTYTSNIFTFISSLVSMLFNVGSLFFINVYIGLFGIGVFLLLAASFFIYRQKLQKMQGLISEKRNTADYQLNSSLKSFKRLHSLNQSHALGKMNQSALMAIQDQKQKQETIKLVKNTFLGITARGLQLIILVIAGWLIFTTDVLDIGKIVAASMIFNYLAGNSLNMMEAIVNKSNFKEIEKKLETFLKLNEKSKSKQITHHIQAQNLMMKFNQEVVFDDLNFEFKVNDKVLIYGRSGRGKSTLIKLILGIINPFSGLMSWGNRKADVNNLVSKIAYVQNMPQLFKGSVDQNITLFAPSIDQEKLVWAKKIACVDFDSANALKLSTGQKQRIEIATALYCNMPTIIFDESLANIDPHHSNLILEQITSLKDHQIIVISHHIKEKQKALFSQILHLKKDAYSLKIK